MWTKWLLVFGLTISACARISGLQNDLSIGYSYRQPEDVSLTTVPASLAYYINIPAQHPAGQSVVDYYYLISRPESQYNRYPSQYNAQEGSSAYRQPQYAYSQDLGYNRQPDVTRVHIYRPQPPSDQQQHILASPPVNTGNDFAASGTGYHVEPRSRPQQPATVAESSYRPQLGRSVTRAVAHQDYQDHSGPSQELTPPPYNSHGTAQFASKGIAASAAKQQYRGMTATASLPTSYNAQLPFAFGTVPIKFKPFPLKTHLREEGLLPITSYQARESYKK